MYSNFIFIRTFIYYTSILSKLFIILLSCLSSRNISFFLYLNRTAWIDEYNQSEIFYPQTLNIFVKNVISKHHLRVVLEYMFEEYMTTNIHIGKVYFSSYVFYKFGYGMMILVHLETCLHIIHWDGSFSLSLHPSHVWKIKRSNIYIRFFSFSVPYR